MHEGLINLLSLFYSECLNPIQFLVYQADRLTAHAWLLLTLNSPAYTHFVIKWFLLVILAVEVHPVPSRTRQLSPPASMVVCGRLHARVDHC